MPVGEPLVRGYAVTHPSGTVVLPQGAGWDQLVYAARGVMTVETADGRWTVPPHRAVWVPAGVRHRLIMSGRVAVRTLYLAAELGALPGAGCRAVNVPPLLRELVLRAVRTSPLDADDARAMRLVGVLLDELAALPVAPLRLPVPSEPRAHAVAQVLIHSPDAALEDACRAVGASRRTVERLFTRETGVGLGQWRQRAQLMAALPLLAAGSSVSVVAARVGYATPSAFTYAFRREFGVPPARYFAPAE